MRNILPAVSEVFQRRGVVGGGKSGSAAVLRPDSSRMSCTLAGILETAGNK